MDNVITSDGGRTGYYELPAFATQLQHLIEHRRMNFAVGNIFKAAYRLGVKAGVSRRYDLRKIIEFAEFELARMDREEADEVLSDAAPYDKPHPVLGAPPAADLLPKLPAPQETLNAYERAAQAKEPAFPPDLPKHFRPRAIAVPAQKTFMNANLWRDPVAGEGDDILIYMPEHGWIWRTVLNLVKNMTGNHYRVRSMGTAELLVPFNHIFAIRNGFGEVDIGFKQVQPAQALG